MRLRPLLPWKTTAAMEDSPKTSLLSLSSLCHWISQVMQLDANGYVDVFVVVDNGHVVVDT